MNDLIELTEEEWFDTFKPIPNHIDDNASFNDGEHGYMFETYDEELAFVKSQDPNRIWTYCDGDDRGTYIFEGMRIVNRIGYFVTAVPFDANKDYQIQISKDEVFLDFIGRLKRFNFECSVALHLLKKKTIAEMVQGTQSETQVEGEK